MINPNHLRDALERIRDKARSWEGRADAPFWNLGDIAATALQYEATCSNCRFWEVSTGRCNICDYLHEDYRGNTPPVGATKVAIQIRGDDWGVSIDLVTGPCFSCNQHQPPLG